MKVAFFLPHEANFLVFEKALDTPEKIPTAHLANGILIFDQDIVVARAALYINPEIKYQDYKVGLVGAYFAQDNDEVANVLFLALEELAQSHGLNYLLGPMNGSTWENYRFHDNPEKPLFLLEMSHPFYYLQQWANVGFTPIAKYFSSESFTIPPVTATIRAARQRFADLGVQIRPIDRNSYRDELAGIFPFLLKAFEQNFLSSSSITKESFIDKYLAFGDYIDPEFVQIAVHESKIVGVFFAVEDLLDRDPKTLIIKSVARDAAPLYTGLGHVMASKIYESAAAKGIQRIIHAFLKEDGTSVSISKHFAGIPFKTYSLYGKAI